MSSSHHQSHDRETSTQTVVVSFPSSTSSRKKIVLVSLVGTIVIVSLIGIRWMIGNGEEHTVVRFGRTQAIQLDVLNGTKEVKLAQRVTDYLRSQGFDVVEMGNYKSSSVESTLVLDRTGNLDAARQVAEVLGVPESNVKTSVDKSLFLDVSVIVGNDFKQLKTR